MLTQGQTNTETHRSGCTGIGTHAIVAFQVSRRRRWPWDGRTGSCREPVVKNLSHACPFVQALCPQSMQQTTCNHVHFAFRIFRTTLPHSLKSFQPSRYTCAAVQPYHPKTTGFLHLSEHRRVGPCLVPWRYLSSMFEALLRNLDELCERPNRSNRSTSPANHAEKTQSKTPQGA